MTQLSPLTAEQLAKLYLPNVWSELVRGQLRVSEPPGAEHGAIAARLCVSVARFVADHKLGVVFAAETGFKIFANPDTVRAPDVAFVARDRVPQPLPRGFAELAPDFVAEVVSPWDRPGEVAEKVADWVAAGVRMVWVVDPIRRTAAMHRGDGSVTAVPWDGALSGENVLPGLTVPVSEAV